jgi:FMN phosphatase YigB (HAD superfamily)
VLHSSSEGRVVPAFLDDVFLSGDIGLAKTDPAIYRFVAAPARSRARCLSHDRDQMRNIEDACTAGRRTHFFGHAQLPDLLARLIVEGVLG